MYTINTASYTILGLENKSHTDTVGMNNNTHTAHEYTMSSVWGDESAKGIHKRERAGHE